MTALLAASPGIRLPEATRRRRGGLPLVFSLLLHFGLLLLVIVAAEHERPYPDYAPPAPFSMVFEGGGKTPPSIANPAPRSPNQAGSPEPQPSTPPSPPVEAQSPVAPPRLVPTPAPAPAQPEPQPAPLPLGPPRPAPQPPAAAPATLPAAPSPAPEPPIGQPVPRTEAARPLPLPPPVVAAPEAPSRRPAASPQAAPQRQAFAFPAPMDFSLNAHSASHATSLPRLRRPSPGTLDLSFSPKSGGGEITQLHPYGDDQDVGADWANLLTKWWIEHRYYPQEAIRLGQQGEVVLRLMVAHNGHVDSVELQKSSGSPWIDLGALDTLRDANLPALPKGFTDPKLELEYHLHYILIE